VNRKKLEKTKRYLYIAGSILLATVLAFTIFYFIARPSGRLDVVFSRDVDYHIQTTDIDPSSSYIFFGTAEGKLAILNQSGVEIATLDVGLPVLQLYLFPTRQQVLVRTSSFSVCYTYDGKLVWKHEIDEYYPEKIQELPKDKLGLYLRSKRGEKPIMAILDAKTGKEIKNLKLDIDKFDFNPVFMPDGNSFIFEVQTAMIAQVLLQPQMPMVWKANLDTRSGQFSSLEIKVTNSNLVICYFTKDANISQDNLAVHDLFVFDADRLPKKSTQTQDLPLFWQAQVNGAIEDVQIDGKTDTILVRAGTVYLYDRNGDSLAKEPEGSKYFYSLIGDKRYVSAFFLENSSPENASVQFVARGIGREGVLWRYTDTRQYLLPAITPSCDAMVIAALNQKRITYLRLSQ